MKKFLIFFIFSTGLFAQFSRTASYIIHAPSLPATCSPTTGAVYFDDTGAGLGPYYCSAVNTWSPMFASAGSGVTTGVSLTADLPVIGAGGSAVAVGTKTGTGTVFVTNTSPTLVTPTLGAALATSINGLIITSSTGTLTITNAKTLAVTNTLTFSGTDGTVMTFPSTSATIARTDAANTFTGTQTIGALVATTINGNTFTTGTGVLTIAAAKTLTASNTLTFTGTDSSSVAFGAGGTVAYIGVANSWADGVKQTFNPDATSPGLNVGAHTADPSTPANGDIWYESTNNLLRARINGATVSLGAGGGAPTGASYLVLGLDGTLSAERVLTAGSGITLTDAGAGSTLTVAFDSTVLSGVYFALGSSNAITGVGNTCTPSATEACLELVGSAVPSSIDAGGLNVGLTGRFGWMDGTNYQLAVSVAGSGAAEPSAPSAGLAKFAGSTFAVTSIPLGTGVETWLGTPSSANLAAAVTGETGSGALVFGTAPTINGLTFPTAAGGAVVRQTIASGAKALATSAIASAACSAAQTDTATGTATTDVIIATFNGDPTAVTGYVPLTTGMLTIIAYPTTNTVNFKVCNNTSSSITPGAITLNWSVTR